MKGQKTHEEGGGSIRKPNEGEWEANREKISFHYSTRNLPLSEVMEEMEKLGFVATERMYKDKLNKWKMGKNASRQDWLAFAKLYEESRAAGISETFIQIYNKIRRIQDLKKYLKSHDEWEAAFFVEAMSSQVPVPDHVRYCNPDGSDLMIPLNQQLSIFDPGEMQSNLAAAGGSQAAESIPASLRPQLWDASFDQDFEVLDSQELASSAAFAAMSDLSSFKGFPEASFRGSYQSADGSMPQPSRTLDEPHSSSMTEPFIQPQLPELATSHYDPRYSYVTACMLACMYGAACMKESMNMCLQRASTSFRQLCVLQSPSSLTAASTMLTWLLVHAEGNLSERIMMTSFRVAAEALGNQDPACMLLEWMTAAAAKKLKACRVDSSRLRQIWQAFDRALGEEHGHTIIALYCLSFHLMSVDKDFTQAEQYLDGLCVVSERMFGLFHIQTINILATLSRAQHRLKKYLPALETINRSLIAAPLGLNHPHRLELLLRKALVFWKLNRLDETEELYWVVVKGRVATLGIHHKTTIAAHDSLIDVLHRNGTWEYRKDDAQKLLVDPQVSVSDYESWWRRLVEANRANKTLDRASSDEAE